MATFPKENLNSLQTYEFLWPDKYKIIKPHICQYCMEAVVLDSDCCQECKESLDELERG